MLLNPNSQGRDRALEGIANDPFDRPVPGQSLTGESGKWPWEKPPQITNLDEALMTVLERLKNDKKVQKGYDQLITLGLPIETITNTITFGGFVEGLWTVDIAELMKPPLMGALLMYANEKGLPMVMYNNDKDVEETPLDNMSNYELMRTMKENNPVAFEEITAAMDKAAENKIIEDVNMQNRENSFLGQSPEGVEIEAIAVDVEPLPEEDINEQEI
tara:strand:+ start:2111 stop:2761 length:651 start_codon:yes stop_codon:yes gene_type:complete